MTAIRRTCAATMLAAAATILLHVSPIAAQGARTGAWFGVTLPPGFDPEKPPVILGTDYGPRPAAVPAGEEGHTALGGEAIRRHLEAIVGFSRWSRQTREVGSGQLWGRITGLPSGERTMDWVERRLRDAGVPRVERLPGADSTGGPYGEARCDGVPRTGRPRLALLRHHRRG